MAFVSNFDPEKQDPNQSQGPVAPGGAANTVKLAPSGGVGSAGGTSTGSAPQAGGQFATLNQYVNANQGQAAPLAGKITSDINNQYNSLQGQNQSTLQGIQDSVNSGYTPINNDVLAQESSNPVSFASNPGNIQSFQGQLNDKYTGPGSVENDSRYQTQLANVNDAIATGNAQTGSDAGRKQLLTKYEAAPNAGVTGLNSAILAQDPNAQASITQAYKPFSNLTSQLSTGAPGINASIGQAQTDAAQAHSQANKQIQDQTGALNTNVNNELANAQKQYQTYSDEAGAFGSSLQNGTLPTGYGVDVGLSNFVTNQIDPWMAANTPGVKNNYNFANAIPQLPTAQAPDISQVASQGDFDQYSALNQLMGSQIGSPLNGLDASQAGSYKTPSLDGVKVDNNALAEDIQAGLASGSNAQVNANQYNHYLGLMQALNNYQGNNKNAWGPVSWDSMKNNVYGNGTYGSLVPDIAKGPSINI